MTAIDNSFVSAARDEFETVTKKENEINKVRGELNPEANKLNGIAFFAVVAKSMGLDNPRFNGRKTVAREFREIAASFGWKEAKVKLICENAIKMTRHGAFGNAIEAAVEHGNIGNFAQEIGGIFDMEGITNQSKLLKILNPEAEVSVVDEIALLVLKKVGAKKADIKVTKASISTGTVLDDEALQLVLDVAARIDPRAADVAATLVDALNRGSVEIEKVAA